MDKYTPYLLPFQYIDSNLPHLLNNLLASHSFFHPSFSPSVILSPPLYNIQYATPSPHPLTTHLCVLSLHLPEAVPIGQESDPFAVFSSDPQDLVVTGDDPWESVIDPTLNHVIGFGVSTCQIADLIRCSLFGINGFCQWIKICMVELEISPALLEMKLEHVFDALQLLYVSLITSITVKVLHIFIL